MYLLCMDNESDNEIFSIIVVKYTILLQLNPKYDPYMSRGTDGLWLVEYINCQCCVGSSRFNGLVCVLQLSHFLVILTCLWIAGICMIV